MTERLETIPPFHAIGWVENDFNSPAPMKEIRAVESRVVIDPKYMEGLEGLDKEERIQIVFVFHLSKGLELKQHPRGDKSRPTRGVFSLRSPLRPNPIGISEVDLQKIDGNVLYVRGLDALNNSPVLDIKPAW